MWLALLLAELSAIKVSSASIELASGLLVASLFLERDLITIINAAAAKISQ